MDFSQLIFLGLLIVAATGNGFILKQNKTDGKLKVEGGDFICIEKALYQVYLKENGAYTCGGVLIKPNIVLTAAHCVDDLEYGDMLSVVAGTDSTALMRGVTKGYGSVEIFPETIIMHHKYNTKSQELAMKYDIAIIKLGKSFMMSKTISTIDMPTRAVKVDEKLLFTGIGAVDDKPYRPSPCLKAYKPKVVRCEKYLTGYKPPITNFQGVICHKSSKGHRSRIGDSGSPLVNSKGKLAGIHQSSTSSSCQVAVDIFYLLDWIKDVIRVNTNDIV